MSLFRVCPLLERFIADNEWAQLPERFVTREGRQARLLEGCCYLPVESRRGRIKLDREASPLLLWVVTKYLIHRAQTTSSIEALNTYSSIFSELTDAFLRSTQALDDPTLFQSQLIARIDQVIAELRRAEKLSRCYRLIQFYIWASEHYPELGYCPRYGWHLDALVIPGNPKGAAVRSDDPEVGPLHPLLEIPLITAALELDTSQNFLHFQQRAAVALAQCYGRNSANYAQLHENDLVDLLEGTTDAWYILRIPRIKKGFRSTRSDFIDEHIEDSPRRFVQELIAENQRFPSIVEVEGIDRPTARPLFRSRSPNQLHMTLGRYESAFEIYSASFCALLQGFADRMGLISPLTRKTMRLTTRRFRYTVATQLAAAGLSKKELAARLDHTDLQNVDVYYEVLDYLSFHLDKASAIGYAEHVRVFQGEAPADANEVAGLIASDRRVVTQSPESPGGTIELGGCGLSELCHLRPPFSCYLCPKFRPYRSGVHSHLLDMLIKSHNEVIDATKGAVHRMDVIYAVSQVVRMCEEANQ